MRHFTDIAALERDHIKALLSEARALETDPIRRGLLGRVLGLVFLNPSLRTLSSMQAAMAQLGGSSFVLTPGQGTWALETEDGVVMDGATAEHIREALPVLGQYCDVLGVRAFPEGKSLERDLSEPLLRALQEHTRVPLVNLESAMGHPCQALGDWKTLDDEGVPPDGRFVLSWAWHPKPLPLAVPSAVVKMAAQRGMEVTVLRPDGFELPGPILAEARRLAEASGGQVRETSDRAEALRGAHVLYAKSWQSPRHYGDPEAESALRARLRAEWCVGPDWFEPALPEAFFMHCLPVRRNVVVRDAVLDGPRSRVVRQAGNRLHVQKAVLIDLLSGFE